MKTGRYLKSFIALLLIAYSLVSGVPQWQSLGLDSHSINDLAFYGESVIAATQSGLYLNFRNIWYTIENQGLSAQKVLVTGPTRLVAAYGDGSNSDGFYEGNSIINGPPFFAVELVSYMQRPTALAKTGNSQVVYIGNSGSVEYSILDTAGDGYMPLQPMKIPLNSFGVEMPYCAALQVYSGDKFLYAGGYDRSPEPGPGHLLYGKGDSLITMMQLNVSALTEGVIDWGGVKLFIGTIDSGVYYKSTVSSMPPQKFTASPNNEPVIDIVVLPIMIDGGHVCVAVASGVYIWTGNLWEELGNIPAVPISLGLKLNDTGFVYTIYAGTDKGVYVFDSSSVAVKYKGKVGPVNNTITVKKNVNGVITVSFSIPKPEKVTIDILDVSGKTVASLTSRYYSSGSHTVSRPIKTGRDTRLSNGVYIVKMMVGNTVICRRVVFTK